jgi:hypothetical protein
MGHVLDQAEAGYAAAKRELIQGFGDPYAVSHAY